MSRDRFANRKTNRAIARVKIKNVFTITVKFPRADWLVAIVYRVQTIKITSDVTRALSQRKIKLIPLVIFPCYCKKQIDGSFQWSILL